MKIIINNCTGTLAQGFDSYSPECIARVFDGHQVSHILPFDSPSAPQYIELSRKHISLSGIQEKFSLKLSQNQLKIPEKGEQGTHILKIIPSNGKRAAQMPANEHLTMQIARQVFEIETAENAIIFFKNGSCAYLNKRFDLKADGSKWAQEDFASIAGKTPQTHGEHYKYSGNYLELFLMLQSQVKNYETEALKLFKLLIFNFLFSNGDAHLKNFSIIESPDGAFRLSPAYDLLNTRIHIEDQDFALEEGLLPLSMKKGKIVDLFMRLAQEAQLAERQAIEIFDTMLLGGDKVKTLIDASFLDEKTKRNYWQSYQSRLKRLSRK